MCIRGSYATFLNPKKILIYFQYQLSSTSLIFIVQLDLTFFSKTNCTSLTSHFCNYFDISESLVVWIHIFFSLFFSDTEPHIWWFIICHLILEIECLKRIQTFFKLVYMAQAGPNLRQSSCASLLSAKMTGVSQHI